MASWAGPSCPRTPAARAPIGRDRERWPMVAGEEARQAVTGEVIGQVVRIREIKWVLDIHQEPVCPYANATCPVTLSWEVKYTIWESKIELSSWHFVYRITWASCVTKIPFLVKIFKILDFVVIFTSFFQKIYFSKFWVSKTQNFTKLRYSSSRARHFTSLVLNICIFNKKRAFGRHEKFCRFLAENGLPWRYKIDHKSENFQHFSIPFLT